MKRREYFLLGLALLGLCPKKPEVYRWVMDKSRPGQFKPELIR